MFLMDFSYNSMILVSILIIINIFAWEIIGYSEKINISQMSYWSLWEKSSHLLWFWNRNPFFVANVFLITHCHGSSQNDGCSRSRKSNSTNLDFVLLTTRQISEFHIYDWLVVFFSMLYLIRRSCIHPVKGGGHWPQFQNKLLPISFSFFPLTSLFISTAINLFRLYNRFKIISLIRCTSC